MWKQIEAPKVMKVTHALAKRFAEMTPAPNDRHLREKRSAVLEKAVLAGTFRTCEWASAVCDGVEYRVNGKHTSTLFSGMNGEMPKNVSVIVERYQCDNLEDVASLYATFDTRASSRSTGDINRAFAAANPDLAELSAKIINVSATGISYAMWEDLYYQHPAEDRAMLMLSNGDFVAWLDGIIHGETYGRHLQRGPVVAAMFKTYGKSQKASDEFWALVRDASGPKHTTADRTLNDYLKSVTVATGRGAKKGKKHASNREVFVKCIHGWNAWRANATTNLQYHADAPTPAVK